MSLESYIRLYQELLTMVDPDNKYSVEHAVNILRMIGFLARTSGKADPLALRVMHRGESMFHEILRHRDDFAGKPGDYKGNSAKRHRLQNVLHPSC